MYQDEVLDSEAKSIIDEYNNSVNTNENVYVFRLGMWTSAGIEPFESGMEQLQLLKKEFQDAKATRRFSDRNRVFVEKNLKAPEDFNGYSTLLCDPAEFACMEKIWSNTQDIPALLDTNQIFLDRLSALQNLTNFSLYASPHPTNPEIEFEAENFAFKLTLLKIIYEFKHGNPKKALQDLQSLLSFYQTEFGQTRYVLAKVISFIHLTNIMDLASWLYTQNHGEGAANWQIILKELTPFTSQHLSTRNIFLNEFVNFANSRFEMINTEFEDLPWYLEIIPKQLILKPNASANLYFKLVQDHYYSWDIIDGEVVFPESNHNTNLLSKISVDNIFGAILMHASVPHFLKLEPDMISLELKRRLLMLSWKYQARGTESLNTPTEMEGVFETRAKLQLQDGRLCVAESALPEVCIFFTTQRNQSE